MLRAEVDVLKRWAGIGFVLLLLAAVAVGLALAFGQGQGGGISPSSLAQVVPNSGQPGQGGMANTSAIMPKPAAPTGLDVVNGSHAVQLNWLPVAGADQYRIYRDHTLLATTSATNFTDSAVQEDTPYTYRIAAQNAGGIGPFSQSVQVTTYLSWNRIHDLYADSVVHVFTYTSILGVFGGGVTGTGWFAPGGYIVTNDHVVRDSHYVIDVVLHNALGASGYAGQKYHAHVVATDPLHDLAILALDNGWAGPSLPLGDSNWLAVGQPVAILGHPGGEALTLTAGEITALHQTVQVTGYGTLTDMIGFNAGAVGGNSGSPVLNHWGQVIGIDESGGTNNGNANFAVPVNDLSRFGIPSPAPVP